MVRRLLLLPLCFLLVAAAGCKEDGGVKVSSFKFTGNDAVDSGQLKDVLATQASSKIPWGQKRYFSREQFEADLKRIVAFYTDRGYPNARVTGFDAQLSEDQTSVDIEVNIDEGAPLVAERIVLEGFEPLPERRLAFLRRRLPQQEGQPLDRALMQASRELALDQLRDRGYPYASVRLVELPGSTDNARVIELRGEPGTAAVVGEIEISGNSSVGDEIVRRQLTFQPGDPYEVGKLRDSQRRLYNLELFQFANIEPIRTEEQSAVVPTRVTVTEGKHRRVNFSVGYGTEEKARAEIDWRHVNFFGGARTAGVQARYSGIDGGVRLNFKQPYLFSPRHTLAMSAQAWHTAEPAFVLDTRGGRATITRDIAWRGGADWGRPATTTVALTYANEHESYEISDEALADLSFRPTLISLGLDPRFGIGKGQRSALILDANRNTTNNLLNARRGYLANIHLEKAGGLLGGSWDYFEFTTEGRYYQAIGRRLVLAGQARAGSIDAGGSIEANVPFFKRYFLGGATNLRGWGRFEVAPLSGFGLPIGGTTFMSFSTEARFPIWGDLGGVIFLDGGNVWADEWDFNVSDLRYDIGPGLRYNTPVGPIRVDLGYQLNPIDGLRVKGEEQSRRFRFHFSIGQAF
jgi:outer membrane protein assembly complex protein YaeT